MNEIDHIVEHFFHKKSLSDVSVYELERFIATHPYFAGGHFLLAKKCQQDHSSDTRARVSATALYYNNPLWLQWLLEQDLNTKTIRGDGASSHTLTTETPTNDVDDEDEEDFKTIEDRESTGDEYTMTAVNNAYSPGLSELSARDAEESHAAQEGVLEENPDDSQQEQSRELQQEAEQPQQGTSEFQEEAKSIDEVHEDLNKQPEPGHITLEPVASHEDVNTLEPAAAENSAPITGENKNEASNEAPVVNETQEVAQRTIGEIPATDSEKHWTTGSLIPAKAELDKTDFTFEPYYTIDYFASQGIKLQQSDLSKDKFGKQLKSFTDWLRSMKRLPQASVESQLDDATQQSIQRIADHSFEEKDIVTETMAEVWIKQGNKQKAIETLQKLSLQNPSKSHYFAAKIDQLNAS